MVKSLCGQNAGVGELKFHALNVCSQIQHLLLLSDFFLLERHLVGFLLDSPFLAFVLDGLFPCSPLLFALLPVARLGGDPRQVRVVDPRHALGLLGGQASGRKDVQRDTRFTGHTDRLYLWWVFNDFGSVIYVGICAWTRQETLYRYINTGSVSL